MLELLESVIDKISGLTTPDVDPSITPLCPAVFQQCEPVSFPYLSDVVEQLRPARCPFDSIPPCLLKDVFTLLGQAF